MMRKMIVLAVLLSSLSSAGWAQKLESQPGYVPLEELGLFPQDKLEVEINLGGPILRLIAAGAQREDPAFASVMAGLKSIRLQVFPLKGGDAGATKGKVERAVHWLETRGWQSTMRVRDQGQETYIYLKQNGDQIEGLTLLAFDPKDEAVVINIVGRIDPAQLGRLGQRLNMPQLKKVPSQGNRAKKP